MGGGMPSERGRSSVMPFSYRQNRRCTKRASTSWRYFGVVCDGEGFACFVCFHQEGGEQSQETAHAVRGVNMLWTPSFVFRLGERPGAGVFHGAAEFASQAMRSKRYRCLTSGYFVLSTSDMNMSRGLAKTLRASFSFRS